MADDSPWTASFRASKSTVFITGLDGTVTEFESDGITFGASRPKVESVKEERDRLRKELRNLRNSSLVALRKIEMLELERLTHLRLLAQRQELPASLRDLLKLCHPDRHANAPQKTKDLAARVTKALLAARKS